ncbi:MAG: histidinol-phosphatase [Chloroflexi bacterium]|nr:histidinol-phosphatase [Chloroflexota bacterium]
MNVFDSHVHSKHSLDGHDTIDAICRAAIRRGLDGVCFTEHLYLEPWDASFGFFNYDRYASDIESARQRYGDRLDIRSGIEIGYQPQFEDEIVAFLSNGRTFDLVLGSVHYVGEDFVFDTLLNRNEQKAYGRYFETVRRAAQSGLFDVLAHLDVVKRFGVDHYGPFRYQRYAAQIDAILETMIATGTGLEVNTSGLRQNPGKTYPGPDIIARYRELGGAMFSFGSDAHSAVDVGRGVRDAAAREMPSRMRVPLDRPVYEEKERDAVFA